MASYFGSDDANGAGDVDSKGLFNVDGQPIKFFLQKNLPQDLYNSLAATIEGEGGVCTTKLPVKGYVVVLPGTPEAERLRSCWESKDRPERYFVTTSWLEASKKKGKVLSQIFANKDGKGPIGIHIHHSIANLKTREELAEIITNHGGDPTVSRNDATVILASGEIDAFRDMRKELQGDENKFVENLKWLETCIEQDLYFNTPNPVKNPGGRRHGDERTAFTEEDEANLCTWIASIIPYKESGGRTGNKIYQELVSRVNVTGYEWAGRHTWQSWRERYKKNATRLDQHIAAIVNLGQTGGPEKAQFGYFRLAEGKSTPLRRRRRKNTREANEEVAESSTIGTAAGQDSQESSEWIIREAEGPPAAWAKRPVPENSEVELRDQKRLKSGGITEPPMVINHMYATGTEFAADFGITGGVLHPVDQAILNIAHEYHFLPSEVRTFYDRTGDMEATRHRFSRMRDIMNALP